jgi:hypothetical protein
VLLKGLRVVRGGPELQQKRERYGQTDTCQCGLGGHRQECLCYLKTGAACCATTKEDRDAAGIAARWAQQCWAPTYVRIAPCDVAWQERADGGSGSLV